MAIRAGHGSGRGVPRVEVLPPNELPKGVPAPAESAVPATASAASAALRETGDSVAAKELGRLGGLAKAARDKGLRILEGLGLRSIAPENLAPYLADAEAFAVSEVSRLALEVGGGTCGPMPASMVQSAALELAGSRAAFADGDTLTGSKLASASRQNLLGAFELCARQAKARPKESPRDRIAREIAANRKEQT